MEKLSRVIQTEIAAPSLITLAVLTFVIFSREFGRLVEMLIRKNADGLTLVYVVLSLLPNILIFTVPFSFLIGTFIGFSRLAADSEIVAMRAGGVSIYQMLRPVLRMALLVSAVTLMLTLLLLPEGNWMLRQIRHQIGLRPVPSEIKPRVFHEDFPGMILYVEDMNLQNSTWMGVFLADGSRSQERRLILANRAYPIFSSDASRLQLHFQRGTIYKMAPETPEKDSLTTFQTLDVPVPFPEREQVEVGPKKPRDKRFRELLQDLRSSGKDGSWVSWIELQRRLALPLSPIIFAVLAVTLAAHAPRGSRGYGFLLSVVIAVTYYLLFATGTELAEDGAISVIWGVWGANLLLALLALLALQYGSSGPRPLLSRLDHRLGRLRVFYCHLTTALARLFYGMLRLLRRLAVALGRIRLQILRVIDRYLNQIFISYFATTLLVCISLVYLFTFFELIDDFFAHGVPEGVLLDYSVYLLPHVLMRIVPISMLIATLITFGLLERTNQVVALKACGVSVYRLAIPVLAVGLTVSCLVFVVQEYVLPYSNQRQDSLRNIIKGLPVQTHYQMGRTWIFGQGNRLYHYNYFDPDREVFAELSVYELDIRQNRLLRHIYAQRAEWDAGRSGWILYSGWQRSWEDSPAGGFSRFQQAYFFFPETPGYFRKEVKESSKMTYAELRDYILSLQMGGFEVDHLRTELHKKISFPLVSLIMAVLGIPFAFSLGRKGTLYGIAVGVLIGIVYWGAFGVFSVLGANGLLSPALAAWGPNLLFGAAGVLLFSGVRS